MKDEPCLHICVMCASVFEYSSAGDVKCGKCGFAMPRDRYDALLEFARSTARSFFYMMTYDRQVREFGEVRSHYMYEPDTLSQFVVLAIASGVIGNAAWCLCEAAIRKIKDAFRSRGQLLFPPLGGFADSKEGLEEHVLESFKAYMENLDRRVRELEDLINRCSRHTSVPRANCEDWDQVQKEMQEQIKRELLMKLSEDDLRGFWGNINKSSCP